MKIIFHILFLSLPCLASFGQENKIDSLIEQLNNNEIKPDGNIFGPTFYLSSGAATELIKIGKPVTKKIFPVLIDSAKGVVAHLILTVLWKDSFRAISPKYIEKENITAFNHNNLVFFIKNENVFTKKENLKSNAILWKEFLQEKKAY